MSKLDTVLLSIRGENVVARNNVCLASVINNLLHLSLVKFVFNTFLWERSKEVDPRSS